MFSHFTLLLLHLAQAIELLTIFCCAGFLFSLSSRSSNPPIIPVAPPSSAPAAVMLSRCCPFTVCTGEPGGKDPWCSAGPSTAKASLWFLFGVAAGDKSPRVESSSRVLGIARVACEVGGVSGRAEGERIAARECGDGMAAVVGACLGDPDELSTQSNSAWHFELSNGGFA